MIIAIGKYLLRILIFSILVGYLFRYFENISSAILSIHIPMLTEFENSLLHTLGENLIIVIALLFGFSVCTLSDLLTTYYFAKICGLFKKIDGLKKWQSFLIVTILAIFFFQFSNFLDNYKYVISGDIRVSYGFVGMHLIPAYLLYKFFGFLTKKYPNPFEKIGYYSSAEFYKNLFKKILSRIKKNEG